MLSLTRLARGQPAPTGAESDGLATPIDPAAPKVAAEIELLLAKAQRERAEAAKMDAQAAYWRERAEHAGEAEHLPAVDLERAGREAKREELEIEGLELSNLTKLVGLALTLGGLAVGMILTAVGGGHLESVPHHLLSWLSQWGQF